MAARPDILQYGPAGMVNGEPHPVPKDVSDTTAGNNRKGNSLRTDPPMYLYRADVTSGERHRYFPYRKPQGNALSLHQGTWAGSDGRTQLFYKPP